VCRADSPIRHRPTCPYPRWRCCWPCRASRRHILPTRMPTALPTLPTCPPWRSPVCSCMSPPLTSMRLQRRLSGPHGRPVRPARGTTRATSRATVRPLPLHRLRPRPGRRVWRRRGTGKSCVGTACCQPLPGRHRFAVRPQPAIRSGRLGTRRRRRCRGAAGAISPLGSQTELSACAGAARLDVTRSRFRHRSIQRRLWPRLERRRHECRALGLTQRQHALTVALPRYARKVAGVLAQQPLW
jgi:hypothetical protein